jgi:enamine deaminase RidA (YjgF/YER057c/UK114 family)
MKKHILTLFLIGFMPAYAQLTFIQPSVQTGSSAAVIVDDVPLTHTAQIFPLDKNGKIVGRYDIKVQIAQVLKNAQLILKETRSDLDKLVKLNVHLSSEKFIPEIEKQFSLKFPGKTKPAVTYIIYKLRNGADIAIDLVAVSDAREEKTKYFNAANTKAAILPPGGVTYISGQADKGDLEHATQGTLRQLDASLKHLGIDKRDVVQLKAYMNNTTDISLVEKQLAAYFTAQAIPPIVYVEWVSKEYEIEIELIAATPKPIEKKESAINFLDLPGMVHSPVYSKATQINYGKKIYFSGLYGITLNNSDAQTAEIFSSLQNLLLVTGSDFTHLAKATYFHTDVPASVALNAIRPKYYDPYRAPAATKAMLKVMPEGKNICIDMIGVVK